MDLFICMYTDTASSVHVFQVGFTIDKCATNGYNPAKRLKGTIKILITII